MRRFLLLLSLLLLAVAAPGQLHAQAADTSDLFLNAYMANEQGQQLESSGDTQRALAKYKYAASLLDQITRDDPQWQPLVVDYRKKKVAENIVRLQQQPGETTPTQPGANPPIDGQLPQKELQPNDMTGGNQAPPATNDNNPPTAVREQLDQLQSDLNDSRKRLRDVESQKEDLANKLSDALKKLDTEQVNVSELGAQLKQAQDALSNATVDSTHPSGTQKELQARVVQLENALKDAEANREADNEQSAEAARREKVRLSQLQDALKNADADREAADEQNADAARKNTLIAKQRDTALAHNKDIEAKYADASKLATQLDAANKKIASLTKDRDTATQHAADLDKQVDEASKTAAKLADAQKQIATLKTTDADAAKKNDELTAQLSDAHKQLGKLTSDRDAAQKQITALDGKLADAQKEIASVKTDRDSIAAQRDQALADLAKARDAQKHVDQLIAQNATLMAKVAGDEKIIKDFKSDSPQKDKEIADLRKQVSDTKALLTATQQDRDNVQTTLNDLQQQYDSATSELASLKANKGVSDTEKQSLTDENGLLRGIVLRELKQQARRDEAKRLVMSELSQLQVQSDTLLQQINLLGQPVVQLTPQERTLFKDPSLDIPDAADESSMDITIAAPRQKPLPSATPAPAGTAAATTQSPQPTPPAGASPTPMVLASRAGAAAQPGNNVEPPLPSSSPDATSNSVPPPTDTGTSGADQFGSMVPPELMDQARSAKESFERGEYRDAEKTYEKMLIKAPNNVYVLSNLGVTYYRNQKYQLAEESLKKSIAVQPEDVFSHTTLGIVYYQQKQYDDAINSLTRALAINPKYAVAHNYLGITASQKGWQEAAVKELETALDIDPTYADAAFNLAVVYAMKQPPDKANAEKYYKRAVDLGAAPDPGLESYLK
jgi:Flp pilus assembly protein TadD